MRNRFLVAMVMSLCSCALAHAQTEPAAVGKGSPVGADGCCARECDEQSCRRAWFSAEYLLWWSKSGPLSTPLVTTGSLTDIPPGALGQPGTRVLFGDSGLDYGSQSGMRLGFGVGVTECLSVEGSYLWLEHGTDHFQINSDASGNPLITRPFFSNQLGLPDTLGTADPDPNVGPWAGGIAINSRSQLQSWELNVALRRQVSDRLTVNGLVGFRSLILNEDLTINESIIPLVPGVLTFIGQPADPPSQLSDFDRFHAGNTFLGGQIGGRAEWHATDRLSVGVVGKLALGVTQEVVTIEGNSTITTPGAGSATVPGGVLALPTNSGRHYHSTFAVVPEAGVTVGWDVTSQIKATAGYNIMYWSRVVRPGSQIDPELNAALIPTAQSFGNGLGTARPLFSFKESDYWAQGLSLGLELKF